MKPIQVFPFMISLFFVFALFFSARTLITTRSVISQLSSIPILIISFGHLNLSLSFMLQDLQFVFVFVLCVRNIANPQATTGETQQKLSADEPEVSTVFPASRLFLNVFLQKNKRILAKHKNFSLLHYYTRSKMFIYLMSQYKANVNDYF